VESGSLPKVALGLADVWKSLLIGQVGEAKIKVIKMGGQGIPPEFHPDFDELVVVIEGEMPLIVEGRTTVLRTGDFYLIPKHAIHSVPPGSHGTLLLIDQE